MPRLLLIANPSSSQFTGGGHRTVARILSRAFEVEAAWPQSADHARQLTAEAVAKGFEVVAAMGGDGIAHHVGSVLAGTETALALIPTGTTNVYARLLGIPRKPIPAARLLAGHHRLVTAPLLVIDGETGHGPARHHALFAAGFGFDAEVVQAAESEPYRKYRFGGLHYARTAVSTLLSRYRRRRPQIKVRIGEETVEAVAVLVQFHSVYTYFGRLPLQVGPVRPSTMTALTVAALPARLVPAIGLTLLRGGDLSRLPDFRVWSEVEEVALEATPPVAGQADGELTGSWGEARVGLRPHALSVVVPGSAEQPGGSAPPIGR